MHELAIFTKQVADELIKRGYELKREQKNIYFFLDSEKLRAAIDDILSNIE